MLNDESLSWATEFLREVGEEATTKSRNAVHAILTNEMHAAEARLLGTLKPSDVLVLPADYAKDFFLLHGRDPRMKTCIVETNRCVSATIDQLPRGCRGRVVLHPALREAVCLQAARNAAATLRKIEAELLDTGSRPMQHTAEPGSPLAYYCKIVGSLKVGESFSVSAMQASHVIPSYEHKGAIFTAADRIMGNIIGSAYELSLRIIDGGDGRYVFTRHPPSDTPRYCAPDQRPRPDGPFFRKEF